VAQKSKSKRCHYTPAKLPVNNFKNSLMTRLVTEVITKLLPPQLKRVTAKPCEVFDPFSTDSGQWFISCTTLSLEVALSLVVMQ